jgi:murein DD-endopeptidase MepM/ murein hydrolase activator NlpD
LNTIGEALRIHADALTEAKAVLSNQHKEVNETKSKLSYLNTDLVSQKKALDANRASKQTLLTETQNEEAAYQRLIEEKRTQQKAFEAELRALESELQIAIDPTRIPSAGAGVLRWPFLSSFMESCVSRESALKNPFCITQYFGNTSFSTANPQIYNGNGHPGVDFGAPSGTPIAAALSGTVLDTGNTDAIPGCYSFGKWVVIKHPNGLATLYAHLSSIGVSAGQSVITGDVIGNSGMTGYATGPHLHFGVYASEGVRIMTLAEFRGATTPCANAKIPVAPQDAYLNPMSYF